MLGGYRVISKSVTGDGNIITFYGVQTRQEIRAQINEDVPALPTAKEFDKNY